MKRRQRFQLLLSNYRRYIRKLARVDAGQSRYRRRDLLLRRLKQVQDKMMSLAKPTRRAALASALASGLLLGASSMNAQNFELQSNSPLRDVGLEASAKPVLLDWDSDGDMDLFVGGKDKTFLDSRGIAVEYYRNDDGQMFRADSPFPDSMPTPAILADTARVSPTFMDLDADGDMDAFLGIADGTLQYYRNDDGAMVMAEDENPFAGIIIGNSKNASPHMADVDGDGDLDAVIGKYSGAIAYFENVAGVFEERTDVGNPFSDVNVSESAAPVLVDFDADDDLDLFVGNKAGELAFFTNDGGVFSAVGAENNPFNGLTLDNNSAPAFGDLDGDGDLDVLIGASTGKVVYVQNDEGVMSVVPTNMLGIPDLGTNLNGALGDLDGDGDLDIIAGEFGGILLRLTNDGGTFVQDIPHSVDASLFQVGYVSSPAFADLDADGDEDLFVGSYQDGITFLQNDGNDMYTLADAASNPLGGIDVGDNENIAFADWDGDDDLDAFIGNKAGFIKYYANNDGMFAEDGASNPFEGIFFDSDETVNYSVKPAIADFDGDGDLDAVIGNVDGTLHTYRNDDGTMTELTGSDNPFDGMDFVRSAAPEFGDMDGDGDMDLLVMQVTGLSYYFENTGSVAIKDYSQSTKTSVFPNPASDILSIEAPWLKGNGTLRLLDVNGKVLHQTKVFDQLNTLSLRGLPVGTYLVTLESTSGNAIKRLVKK